MPVQKWSDSIWIAQLSDGPSLSEDFSGAQSQLDAAAVTPDLVVDLAPIEHLNSSHLSALLRLRKTIIDGDARLRLVGPRDSVWAVFLATGLDKVFEFTEDTATALAQLQIG